MCFKCKVMFLWEWVLIFSNSSSHLPLGVVLFGNVFMHQKGPKKKLFLIAQVFKCIYVCLLCLFNIKPPNTLSFQATKFNHILGIFLSNALSPKSCLAIRIFTSISGQNGHCFFFGEQILLLAKVGQASYGHSQTYMY